MIPVVRLLRPEQWIKNLVVFAALVFSRRLFVLPDLIAVVGLFVSFCAVASAVYIFNDWIDAPQDRSHPRKRLRPLAAGTISVSTALWLSATMAVAGIVMSALLDARTGALLATYLGINLLYTVRLKGEPLLDVGCVASGFVIRAFAGATVIDVPISRWLVLCSLFLALFLAFAKRRQEISLLEGVAVRQRPVLVKYSLPLLDHLNAILASATLISYALYTVDDETVERFGTDDLVFTVPLVIYGVFRYLFLIHRDQVGADPTRALLQDRALQLTVLLWGVVAAVVIYR